MSIKKLNSFLLIILFVSSLAFAQEASQDEQMKIWMDYMTPGEVHKAMASYAGDWKTDTKMWIAPGSEPIISSGESKSEMLLGGRYMKITNTGNYMGMPFEGISIEGYDNVMKQFTFVWIDNFGTGTMILKGTYDDATKSINYKGTMVDPVQKKEMPIRQVVTLLGPDKLSLEMFSEADGKEFKNTEVIYTRK